MQAPGEKIRQFESRLRFWRSRYLKEIYPNAGSIPQAQFIVYPSHPSGPDDPRRLVVSFLMSSGLLPQRRDCRTCMRSAYFDGKGALAAHRLTLARIDTFLQLLAEPEPKELEE